MERFAKLTRPLGRLDRARVMLVLGLIPVLGMSILSMVFWSITNESINDTRDQADYLLLSAQLLEVESKTSQAVATSKITKPGNNIFAAQAEADRREALEAIQQLRSQIDYTAELLAPISGQRDPETLAAFLDERLEIAESALSSTDDINYTVELDRLDSFSATIRPLWESAANVSANSSAGTTPWSPYDRFYLSSAKYEQAWMLERQAIVREYLGQIGDGGSQFQELQRTEAFRSILASENIQPLESRLLAESRIDQATVLAASVPDGHVPMNRWVRDAVERSDLSQTDIRQSAQRSAELRNDHLNDLKRRQTLIVATSGVVVLLAGLLFIVSRSEISHRRAVERAHSDALNALDERARRDPATGMWNRRQLNDELQRCLDRQESDGPVILLYIDLDQFKPINDIWGHAMGDQILQVVSDRLRGRSLEGYSAIRFGGDEFILFGNKENATVSSAIQLGEHVIDIISQPIAVGKQQFNVSATAGVTVSDPSSTSEELLLEADTVLILSKRSARGTANSYDRATTRSSELLKALPTALENGEITCFYQPISDLATGQLHHLEALARWIKPDGTSIPTAEFIPIIELFGLTTDLMSRVIEDIARFMHHPSFPSDVNIWFNVSAKEFEQAELATQVLDKIRSHNLDPHRLGVEINETSVVDNSKTFNDVSSRLRSYGMGVAIDNFGAGHSPLGLLFDLEVDAIKIDRKLIEHVESDPRFASIVQGIVGALQQSPDNIKVIAEGVETVEQLRWLKDSGVDYVQGFLSAGPHPMEQYITSWRTRSTKKPKQRVRPSK